MNYIYKILLIIGLISLSANAKDNNFAFYIHNIGMQTNLVDIQRYENTPTKQDVLKNRKNIKIQYKIINEILNKKFLDLFDNNYMTQIIIRDKFAIVSAPSKFFVLKDIKINTINKQISKYNEYKNKVLNHINTYQYEYLKLSSQIMRNTKISLQSNNKSKKNIYIIATYLPKLRGRVDTYEKLDRNRNNVYSVETDLKVQIKIIIFKYNREADIFEIQKEISTPFEDVMKPEDKDSFKSYSLLSSSSVKRAISVNLYESIDKSIDYIKMKLANIDDFQKSSDYTTKPLPKETTILNSAIKKTQKLDDIQQINEDIPVLEQEQEKTNNTMGISYAMQNIPTPFAIGPISYQSSISTKSISLDYQRIFKYIYIMPSYTYNIASLKGDTPQINGFNQPVNGDGYKASSVTMHDFSIELGKSICFGNFCISPNIKTSLEYINMGFKDDKNNAIKSILSNILLSPGLNLEYVIDNLVISGGASYNLAVFKVPSNPLFKSLSDDFKRKNTIEFNLGVKYKF